MICPRSCVSLRERQGVQVHRQGVHHGPVPAMRSELQGDAEVGPGWRRRQEGLDGREVAVLGRDV